MAVVLAVETGVPHTAWLEDPRAMMTAAAYLTERAKRHKG